MDYRELLLRFSRLIKRESFQKYIFVGLSTVLIDYAVLFILRERFNEGLFSAVTIAYWVSIAYNFFMNRNWSFGSTEKKLTKQLVEYGLLLIFNYGVTVLVITGLGRVNHNEYLAKAVALALTVSWTYFVYQKVIFVSDASKN